MAVIQTYGLSKKFGKELVIKDIDLLVKKGEVYGFLGKNGAGKSTFINMLTGIVRPTEGTIKIFGQNNLNDNLKKRIGVLPDYSSFYNELTAIQHLKYYSQVSGCKITNKQCEDVLEKVGLHHGKYKRVGKYSFGMKKKLGIAQALIHQPDLIFLDEPTSGIDIESALYIHELIKDLHRLGKTIFITSHNLAETEKLCTRIAIMDSGVIINEGTIEELRNQYDSTIELIFTYKVGDSETEIQDIKRSINKYTSDYFFKKETIHITLHDNRYIPSVIRLISNNLNIYDVNLKKPTLEEIFLRSHEHQTKCIIDE